MFGEHFGRSRNPRISDEVSLRAERCNIYATGCRLREISHLTAANQRGRRVLCTDRHNVAELPKEPSGKVERLKLAESAGQAADHVGSHATDAPSFAFAAAIDSPAAADTPFLIAVISARIEMAISGGVRLPM